MKRTPLTRKSPLKAKPSLSRPERPSKAMEDFNPSKPNPRCRTTVQRPGRREWYNFEKWGPCDGCGKRVQRTAHHVLLEQKVERIDPSRVYDVANRMLIGERCGCHAGHHHPGVNDTRLSIEKIPRAAIGFAYEILGEAAQDYFYRRYRAAPNPNKGAACQ